MGFGRVFLTIFVLALVEVMVLAAVADFIGWPITILMVVVTALLGTALFRSQGLQTWQRLNQRMNQGEIPGRELAEGMMLLLGGAFLWPRDGGHDDAAHPPIHPVRDGGGLSGDEARLYELVARRFLACCGRNAEGSETVVKLDLAGEEVRSASDLPPTSLRYRLPYTSGFGTFRIGVLMGSNFLEPLLSNNAFKPTVVPCRKKSTLDSSSLLKFLFTTSITANSGSDGVVGILSIITAFPISS